MNEPRSYDNQAAGLLLVTGIAFIIAAFVLMLKGEWTAALLCGLVILICAAGMVSLTERAHRRANRVPDRDVVPWTSDLKDPPTIETIPFDKERPNELP